MLTAILATWFQLLPGLTTPTPRPDHYVGERVSTAGNLPAAVYQRRSTVYVTPVPKQSGQSDTLWVSLSQAWLDGGGYAHRVWPVYADGDSGAPWLYVMGASTVNACTLTATLPDSVPDGCGGPMVAREDGLDSLIVLGNAPTCCTEPLHVIASFPIRGLEGTRVHLIFGVEHPRMQLWALVVDKSNNRSCRLSNQVNWRSRQ